MATHTLRGLFSAIADAIRAKTGGSADIVAGDFPTAIAAIPTGTTPTGTINITSNGTVDVTQYASAVVAVPSAQSGTYTPASTQNTHTFGVQAGFSNFMLIDSAGLAMTGESANNGRCQFGLFMGQYGQDIPSVFFFRTGASDTSRATVVDSSRYITQSGNFRSDSTTGKLLVGRTYNWYAW